MHHNLATRLRFPRWISCLPTGMMLSFMRRHSYLLLVAVVLAVYAPALFNDFVWDDTALILRDPLIRSPWLLGEGLRHYLFLDATPSAFYRPLQRIAFTLDYTVGGLTPWVFHLTSLLVHAAAAAALFGFLRRILARDGRGDGLALAVALAWAVHPVHTSAVAYASGMADPLAALAGFAGLALLAANRRIAAGVCLGAAVFAKESGAFLVLAGLGWAWILAEGPIRERFQKFARTALPAVVLMALYLGLRSAAAHTVPPAPQSVPAAVRPILGLRAVAEYTGLLIAPVRLSMERDVTTQTGGEVAPTLAAARARDFQTLAGAALVAAALLWAATAKKGSETRRCLASALVTYLPVSNLFTLNATVAEHWIYVPSAFLLAAAAASLREASVQRRAVVIGTTAFALWTLALGVRTAVRCRDWRTHGIFVESTLRTADIRDRMLVNRGSFKLSRGNPAGAVLDFREALKDKPDQPFAMIGMAEALIKRHAWKEAREWLDRCERIPLVRSEALVSRAVLEFQETGRDRVDLLRMAVAADPEFWPVRRRYIGHLVERGDWAEALRELHAVLQKEPFRIEAWTLLNQALSRSGQHDLAIQANEQVRLYDIHFRAN